jgi:uncharacterized membrane protein YsdA (DUF1294 family)/cold shock CspA family protein
MPSPTSERLTGQIESWDLQKGYGYIESDGQRYFLHVRDFAKRHKTPEAGDVLTFSLGTDRKGRSCATQAIHRNDGGRLSVVHFGIFTGLLIAPCLAGWRFGSHGFWFLVGWAGAMSIITYWLYANDKKRARLGESRASETSLQVFALIGGWPGAFLAQHRLRHKCAKVSFQCLFWLIVAVHEFVAIDFLLGWRMTRAVFDLARGQG